MSVVNIQAIVQFVPPINSIDIVYPLPPPPYAPTFAIVNMRTLDKLAVFLAELIGTGLLMFFGCAGCLTWGAPASALQMTLNFGLTVMIVIQIFGCVSGAHLNPCVSIAAFIYRQLDVQMTALYIVAQLLGGFMGFGLLKVLTPPAHFGSDAGLIGHCMTWPHPDVTVWQALGIEFMATMVLVLVCCGVWDPRNAHTHDSVGLRFGLVITALALVAVSVCVLGWTSCGIDH